MTIKTASIKIPTRFFDDHVARELPAPSVLKRTKTHLLICALSQHLPELLSDADYYSEIVSMSGDSSYLGLQTSARATARAIRAAL